MTVIMVIILVNFFTISIFLSTTKYLDYIDKQAQKDFEIIRKNLEHLESFQYKNKFYKDKF